MSDPALYYLGPQGSFCEEAAIALGRTLGTGTGNGEMAARPHIAAVLEEVTEHPGSWGVVPAENSTEGSVNLTWDLLLATEGLEIVGEFYLPVRHHLLVQRGTQLSGIGAVLSHPQALAQCRDFLRRNLRAAKQHEVSSTAEAARVVSVNSASLAAIGSEAAGLAYGLDLLVRDIQDVQDNTTRFLLVTRCIGSGQGPARTGRDRTSLVCAGERNKPGSLRDILSVFADRGIDLSRVESRPARRQLGEYVFFIDLEGHSADPTVSEALIALREAGWLLRDLGSYPRA